MISLYKDGPANQQPSLWTGSISHRGHLYYRVGRVPAVLDADALSDLTFKAAGVQSLNDTAYDMLVSGPYSLEEGRARPHS